MTILKEVETFHQASSAYLSTCFEQLFNILQNYINTLDNGQNEHPADTRQHAARATETVTTSLPALEQLCRRFSLSEFERYLLLLCAAIEVDPRFPELCAKAQGDNHCYHPTFGLALSALPNSHWSAIAPDSSLRHWRLISLGTGNHTLINTPLQIDERILHYLLGVKTTDPLLTDIAELSQPPQFLVPSHQALADNIESLWQLNPSQITSPIIQLCGPEIEDKTDIAQMIAQALMRRVSLLNCHRIPLNPEELSAFIRRLVRECLLDHQILLLNCDDLDLSDQLRRAAIHQLFEDFQGFMIVATRSPLQGIQRSMVRFDVSRPDAEEQRLIWEAGVDDLKSQLADYENAIPKSDELAQDLKVLTAQFQLSSGMIRRACTATAGQLTLPSPPSLQQALWQNCRVQARPGLDELAERIESKLSWDDLVLPPLQKDTLQEISAHVRQRAKVYEDWGFASKNRRGLGIAALFSGPSGTGKTFAAGVIANELNLDLYKIELSAVVSKYIGETEKNLQRIFDAAESGGVILLFDEADSIFGKRSEVSDAKDRYANLEVSYLLQRMESYNGLAILTTNLQSNLDPAFMRRLRFVTQFSLPDVAHRVEIWRRIFSTGTPTQGLSLEKLAQLNAPGGNIRIIALNAAFLAADAGEPVQMKHILQATQTEYEKLGKSLTSVEIAGWVNVS